jgi:membrane protease YdiL (CAAX protease family)
MNGMLIKTPNIMGNSYKRILTGYAVIIAAVALGLVILILSPRTMPAPAINPSVIVFFLFVVLNIASAYVLKQSRSMREYWSAKKIIMLPVAVLTGAVIAVLPVFLSIAMGKIRSADIAFAFNFSFVSAALTFIIVAWEELWFRGIFLNYCNRYLPAVHLSFVIGLLFMLLHIMNPEISLLKKGPALFCAGTLLTMTYFYFKSIWIPVGIHFGNNYFGSMLKLKNDNDLLWGGDGYMTAIVLFICILFLLRKMKDKFPVLPALSHVATAEEI